MAVIKYSPSFPVPAMSGIGVAAPIRYGAAGTLRGVMVPTTAPANDRRLILTKNDAKVAEWSNRQRDEKGFLALEEPIAVNDVFRLYCEAESLTTSIIYCSLLADIAPNNVYLDFGHNRTSDLTFDAGTNISNSGAGSIAEMSESQKTIEYLTGRFVTLDITTIGVAAARRHLETTAGRTGTDFYIRMVSSSVLQAGICRIGISFMAVGSTGYALLHASSNANVVDLNGLFRFSGVNLTAVATDSTDLRGPLILEAIKDDSNFLYIRDRSTIVKARNTDQTAAGSLGIYLNADTSVPADTSHSISNVLAMLA